MAKTIYRLFLSTLCIIAVSACGKANTAPPGSTLTINPTTVTWAVSTGTCSGTAYNFQVFNVSLKNAQGIPLAGTDIIVTLDLASNTSNVPYMQLYDDPNWNGNQSVAPNNPVGTPYKTKTEADGNKRLIVLMDISPGCKYTGNLNVYSGDAFISANLSVTAS